MKYTSMRRSDMPIKRKRTARKKAAPKPEGKWQVRQCYPYTVGLDSQLLPMVFSSEQEALDWVSTRNKECCTVVKVG
jgi:hypothetical protein